MCFGAVVLTDFSTYGEVFWPEVDQSDEDVFVISSQQFSDLGTMMESVSESAEQGFHALDVQVCLIMFPSYGFRMFSGYSICLVSALLSAQARFSSFRCAPWRFVVFNR